MLYSMYNVWIKRNYREIQSIGERIYKIIFKSVIECETCKYYSTKPFYHSFVCFFTFTFHNTLKGYIPLGGPRPDVQVHLPTAVANKIPHK
jgi:hypothetical protein